MRVLKWIGVIAGFVLGVLGIFAGRRRPSEADVGNARQAAADARRGAAKAEAATEQGEIEHARQRDVDAIRDETDRERNDLDSSGDDGFMDRAFAGDRPGGE